ncbi:MAG: Ig-like domain-containing protein [Roseburia sp.]|nr:Ig-like domain-containing protein [Roseburia sp.]
MERKDTVMRRRTAGKLPVVILLLILLISCRGRVVYAQDGSFGTCIHTEALLSVEKISDSGMPEVMCIPEASPPEGRERAHGAPDTAEVSEKEEPDSEKPGTTPMSEKSEPDSEKPDAARTPSEKNAAEREGAAAEEASATENRTAAEEAPSTENRTTAEEAPSTENRTAAEEEPSTENRTAALEETPRKSMRRAVVPQTSESERLELKLTLEAPERVRMYDRLPVTVRLTCGGEDYTDRLLGAGQPASIDFVIKTENAEVKINSKALDCESGRACHQYNIPINEENFNIFLPNRTYTVCATLCMEEAREDVSYCCNSDTVRVVLQERAAKLQLSGCVEEGYDYRTCFGADKAIRLPVDIRDAADAGSPDKEVCSGELSKIRFTMQDYDSNVMEAESDTGMSAGDSVTFTVRGVGTTWVTVNAFGSSVYAVASERIRIVVRNSPLFEEDFVIWHMPEGSQKAVCHSFEQWQNILAEQRNWVSGTVTIALSDTGRKYYDVLAESRQSGDKSDTIVINEGAPRTYCFWAEHTERNASTREAENGTRTFTVGIDSEAPVISAFDVDGNYFAPTKTETEQYYAQDFVLTGSFADSGSGVRAIEYTTDYRAAEGAVEWTPAQITGSTGTETSFCVTLENGSYRAIAVRARDYAGNVSAPCFVKNEKGAFIRIVVDDTVPVLQVCATAGGVPYTGEGERWTNAGVCYRLSSRAISDSPAGIYRYEYAYETIRAAVSKDTRDENTREWETLYPEDDGDGLLRVGFAEQTNRNGYYLFQAVSRSGVRSETPARERILLQQSLAALKEHIQTQTRGGRKNEWYNKASGVPMIEFVYPEYDSGVESGEYAAPITLYYRLYEKEQTGTTLWREGNATIGVTDARRHTGDGFIVTREALERLRIDFEYDRATGYARDGIYALEYWIGDKAGNLSEKKRFTYKIDTHEPTSLTVTVDGEVMGLGSADAVVYERFYAGSVTGSASAEYGVSGKASLKVAQAGTAGNWDGAYEDGEGFVINPCTRCVLCVAAEDGAGNVAEIRTRGIVVDDKSPVGTGQQGQTVQLLQGANENGFYNRDVAIKVSLEDAPDGEHCAGLMRAACAVGRDGESAVQETELFSFAGELPTDAQINEASRFAVTQIVDAKANEGNEACVRVTATDRCGNTTVSTQTLKIDVTSPEVSVMFDNEDAQNGRYYNRPRTALIHIRELNFDPARVEIHATRDGSDITPAVAWRSEDSEHYAELLFAEDGDYTLSVSCTDLADNRSEEIITPPFTIDRTRPRVSVRLMGNDTGVTNGNYFRTWVTAEISVTERNFDSEAFVIKTDASAKSGTWRQNGDTHTLALVFDGDGNHTLETEYTDCAGNPMEPLEPAVFVIDTIAPEICISGVADESANAGEVIPVITIRDANMDAEAVSIAVETGRGGRVQLREDIVERSAQEYACTLSDMTEQADDIYYLTVCAADRAGNKSERSLRFSLNRRGSAYDLSAIRGLLEAYYSTYEALEDIKITEMNVDEVEECRFQLSRNGRILPQIAPSCVEQSGSERLGYTYVYTIAKENFAQEGTYRLGIRSRDRAGNEVNNSLDANGEEIRFVVDNTAPKVFFDGVESGMLYDEKEHIVNVMVTDNFALDEAELTLVNDRGETLRRWEYLDLVEQAGEVVSITIPECKRELSLRFRVRDAAGNEAVAAQGAAPCDFLVTTDKWVQLTRKPAKTRIGRILTGVAAAAGVIALFSAFVLYYRRHKLKSISEKA